MAALRREQSVFEGPRAYDGRGDAEVGQEEVGAVSGAWLPVGAASGSSCDDHESGWGWWGAAFGSDLVVDAGREVEEVGGGGAGAAGVFDAEGDLSAEVVELLQAAARPDAAHDAARCSSACRRHNSASSPVRVGSYVHCAVFRHSSVWQNSSGFAGASSWSMSSHSVGPG